MYPLILATLVGVAACDDPTQVAKSPRNLLLNSAERVNASTSATPSSNISWVQILGAQSQMPQSGGFVVRAVTRDLTNHPIPGEKVTWAVVAKSGAAVITPLSDTSATVIPVIAGLNVQITATTGSGKVGAVGFNVTKGDSAAAAKAVVAAASGKTTTSTTATSGSTTTSSSTSGTSATPATTPEPATTPAGIATAPVAGSIALTIQRADGGSGSSIVANAIPLPPGALGLSQTGRVRVFVGGVEQPVYVEAIGSTHPDGTLRSVVVQFRAAAPAAGYVRFDGMREPKYTLASPLTTDRTTVQAAALPTDPSYLIATDIVGPTISVAASRALGYINQKYESDFVTYADQHWASEKDAWTGDYYDRANIYYAMWARTGNPTYWFRGTAQAVAYRRDYLEASHYGPSTHWNQLEGIGTHYVLTGDARSRYAVGKVGDLAVEAWDPAVDNLKDDARIKARILQTELIAWRINARGDHSHDWGAALRSLEPRILATQTAAGSYPVPDFCHSDLNYMDGMLNDQLIQYYTYFQKDPRIIGAVQRNADYLRNTQWVESGSGFKYLSYDGGECVIPTEDVGNNHPAPDLNNMIVNTFAWTYKMTGQSTYLTWADKVFSAGVKAAWLSGSKQFNEEYTTSYKYFAYRQ